MKKPKLSIVIPMFNSREFIKPCLESVTGYADIEVIVVDDGSTDDSVSYVQEYFDTHEGNFHLYPMPHAGISLTRRTGIEKSSASHIAFLDSDDRIDIDECFYLLEQMKKTKTKVGIGRLRSGTVKFPIPSVNLKRGERVVDLKKEKYELSSFITLFTAKIWHRDVLKLYDSVGSANEDVECVPFMLATVNRFFTTDHVIYQRVNRSGSTSVVDICNVSTSKSLKNTVYPLLSLKEKFQKAKLYEFYKSEVDAICMKQFFERLYNIYFSKQLTNKKEVVRIVVMLLQKVIPDYKENIHFINKFKHMEVNDWFCYRLARRQLIDIDMNNETIDELIEAYHKLLEEKISS